MRLKQKSLHKLKDAISLLEDLRTNSNSEMQTTLLEKGKSSPEFKYSSDSDVKSLISVSNWETFLGYSAKNEQAFAPNIEDSYLKLLKNIIYKIEMSTIVYDNILEEIDAYELKIKLRETGKETSLEGEIQGKKEKIGVMQENFLGNLKNLNDKMFTIKI